MISEQQLKDQCTPGFIKWACEYAEGFEYYKDYIDKIKINFFILWSDDDEVLCSTFPLLLHRAVEGWNKKVKSKKNYIVIGSNATMIWSDNINECKDYVFKNYQPQSLTQVECACLHCLLDIFKEERGDRM